MQNLMPPVNTPDQLFHDGDPAHGIEGTIVYAEHMNNQQGAIRDLQQELLNILGGADILPDPQKTDQLLTALCNLLLSRKNPFYDIKSDGTVDKALQNLGLQETVNRAGNAVQKTGDTLSGGLDITGEVISRSANAFRAVWGDYGFFIRNDGYNSYFLLTNPGDPLGSWNGLRPLHINNANGAATMSNGLTVHDSLGLGTQNALGGNSIVLGDNDTGLKQNGDGILDVYANGAHVFRFINGNNESVRSLVVHGNCHATGALVAGNGSAQVAADGNVHGPLWGGWLSNWLHHNVVKDIRLGSVESVTAWRGPGYHDSWGYVLTGAINHNRDEVIDTLTRRPLQKFIGGQWYTVGSV